MNSKQILVGCPSGFDLPTKLDSAANVKLAMAFAKPSGWTLVKDALLSDETTTKIIVGLNFGITEPDLLDEWLELSLRLPKRFELRVTPQLPVFHPKVTIVRQKDTSCFAIVGSGNLTGGGQLHNVECGAYLDNASQMRELEAWYDGIMSRPLTSKIIEAYRTAYAGAEKVKETAVSNSSDLAAALNEGSSSWYEDLFFNELTHFLSTDDGIAASKRRANGAREIQTALAMPQFGFTKAGWAKFYRTQEFGSIRMSHPEMVEQVGALQRAFRFLLSKPLDADRLAAVLNRNGNHHVLGLGINQISKVLTVSGRRQWPLLNVPVAETLLHYGYKVNWSASGYLQFAQDMRNCLSRAGKVDFWALDAFCEAKSRELDI